jgi:hypothetical protein
MEEGWGEAAREETPLSHFWPYDAILTWRKDGEKLPERRHLCHSLVGLVHVFGIGALYKGLP